jgi:hypothetical protein
MAITVSGTSITFNDATVQTTAATGGVTSAVAGNGVAVSGATGAVTFSLGVPTGSSVGTYSAGMINNTTTTYSIGDTVAGSTINYVSFGSPAFYGAFFNNSSPSTSLGLSGTWRACTISRSRAGTCCQPDQYSGNLWLRIA